MLNKIKQVLVLNKRQPLGRRFLGLTCFFICIGMLILHVSPLPDQLSARPSAKILLSKEGELLAATIASDQQWRFPRIENLPNKYQIAVTQFEDQHFYTHPGVNPLAITRALWGNIKAGQITSGGSTITMQLARMLREDPPRTYWNKLLEVLLAIKLEWHFSKKEILALYASEAPFGGNTVGISAASWRYFGKVIADSQENVKLDDLTWAQAALLAVLPNSPALIHPGRSRDRLKAKRDKLLQALYDNAHLSQNELTLALLEPIPHKPKAIPQLASHLLYTLIQEHPDKSRFFSTLDTSLQKKALTTAKYQGRLLQESGIHNLSIVAINNQSLETEVYLGNITSAEIPRAYGNNVDIANRPRSTGSILKPLLYAAMLQNGDILPNTLIPDIPTNYQGFTPENYDRKYRGAVKAKDALARSLNIPAVRMLREYGTTRFYDDLKNLGMSTLFRPADDYGLSLILGGAEGKLREITGIYAELTNNARLGSKKNQATKILVDHSSNKSPLFNTGTAWLTLSALHEVIRPGHDALWREFSSSQEIAWKTGTSYGLRDAWAIGSNGKYTVGVWAGNAGGEGIPDLSGLSSAAPTMFAIFNFLGHSQWLPTPEYDLKEIQTCVNDGFLANGRCDTEISLAPLNSHFQEISPFNKKIMLDANGLHRVHGACEKASNMTAKNWLILPPAQEFYWKRDHNEYQSLPPWRSDCVKDLANFSNDTPLEILYPQEGAKVYIPLELNGERGRVIFKVSHRNKNARLFWHIDDNYLRETHVFHEAEINVTPGWHKLVVIDELGFRLERWFKVLGQI